MFDFRKVSSSIDGIKGLYYQNLVEASIQGRFISYANIELCCICYRALFVINLIINVLVHYLNNDLFQVNNVGDYNWRPQSISFASTSQNCHDNTMNQGVNQTAPISGVAVQRNHSKVH